MQKVTHQSALSVGWTDLLSRLAYVGLSDAPSKAKPRNGEGGSAVPVPLCHSTHGFSKGSLNRQQGAWKHQGGSHPSNPLPSWHLVNWCVLPTKGYCPSPLSMAAPWYPQQHWPPPGIPTGGKGWFEPGLASFLETSCPWRASLQPRVSHCRED